jgi:hypothetical protein
MDQTNLSYAPIAHGNPDRLRRTEIKETIVKFRSRCVTLKWHERLELWAWFEIVPIVDQVLVIDHRGP